MARRDVVVIGASAGGVEALVRVIGGLPADFPAAVLVVLHLPPDAETRLPTILARSGPLPASVVRDREPLQTGHVYVARPDLHLIVERGRVRSLLGPRVNAVRPAIDPLFRSAARAYGSRVIGVVLSGTLDDGAYGLRAIAEHGGATIVQDPSDAIFGGMPRSALGQVRPDACVAADEIPAVLVDLTAGPSEREEKGDVQERVPDPESELDDAAELPPDVSERAGHASGFTCPECHGSLWEEPDGGTVSYTCRVGHTYSEENMLAKQAEMVEAAIWSAVNVLEEQAALKRRMASRHGPFNSGLAARLEEQAREAEQQAELIHAALLRNLHSHQGEPA